MAITFRRNTGTDLTYLVQESVNLGSWDNVPIAANTVGATNNGDGTSSVVVASTKTGGTVFMRVVCVLNNP